MELQKNRNRKPQGSKTQIVQDWIRKYCEESCEQLPSTSMTAGGHEFAEETVFVAPFLNVDQIYEEFVEATT